MSALKGKRRHIPHQIRALQVSSWFQSAYLSSQPILSLKINHTCTLHVQLSFYKVFCAIKCAQNHVKIHAPIAWCGDASMTVELSCLEVLNHQCFFYESILLCMRGNPMYHIHSWDKVIERGYEATINTSQLYKAIQSTPPPCYVE